jgi:trimeric autotransporter adhesin
MPEIMVAEPKPSSPANGAAMMTAQVEADTGLTPAPVQDPGASLEENIAAPGDPSGLPAPLSTLPKPVNEPIKPSQNDAPGFVPNQGAAFTHFIDDETLDGLDAVGGALEATEQPSDDAADTIEDEFLPMDVAAMPPPVNQIPTTTPQAVTTDEDGSVSGAVTATDPDGDPLTFSLASGPASGTAVVNADGTFTYTPGASLQSLPAGASAADSFTVLVDDGRGGTATATVTVTINGVNDTPTTSDVSVSGDEDGAIGGAVVSSDIDGDTLIHSLDSGPSQGSVIVIGDGTFVYTPGAALQSLPAGASATDTFTVLVDDGKGGTVTSTVTVTITGVNDAPTTADISVTGDEDSNIGGAVVSSDIDADPLFHSLDSGPSQGSVVVNGDGTFVYTPGAILQSLPAGASTTDSFTVLVDDGKGGTAVSTVTVTINGVNDAPTTADIAVSGDEDNKIGGTVTSSDIDGDPLFHSLGSGPTLGSVVVNSDGTFVYTPDASLQSLPAGASVTDGFTVLVDDGKGGSATATVTVTIDGMNDAPIVAGESFIVSNGTLFTVPTAELLANDSDIEGEALSITAVGNEKNATAVLGPGDIAFTGIAAGAASFDYTVSDTSGGKSTATVSLTVLHTDDADNNLVIPSAAGLDALIDGRGGNDSLNAAGGDDTLLGGLGDDTLSGGTGLDSLAGGAGNDVYVVGDSGDKITEAAGEGTDTVQSSLSFDLATTPEVENLLLTGAASINGTGNSLNNQITGNGGTNSLTGGAGNDTLDGGAGIDTLAGGMGDDSYVVDSTTDTITEAAGEGTDTVLSSVAFTIVPLPQIENLTLTGSADINGTGNDGNNVITGNSGKNSLSGGIGNDTLEGGAGIDSLVGGTGNDVFIVDTTTDVITEAAGGGTDTVQSSVTFTIASLAQIENLTLTGTANINGTGNNANNVITGNSGNNALNGGNGIDTLIGGKGDDTYAINTLTDTLVENAGEGTDTISSSVTFDLKTVANIENLTLTGSAALNGTGDDNDNRLTGNTGANQLIGNGGNDTLTGGTGIDTMIGGTGNDVYVIGTTFVDVIQENPGEGFDTLNAQMTFDLTLVANIENLTLANGGNFNGFGDAGNNRVTGNTGNNSLDGRDGDDTLTGGAGTDTLIGGKGNDVFVVDSTGDTITEAAGEGTDRVESTVTFTIAALANIENLTLTGTANVNGTGNTGDNVITGNTGNNKLTGGDGADTLSGGLGNDTLTGGLGNDVYVNTDATDSIVEAAGGGTDRIESAVSFSLAPFAQIENLTLTGSGNVDGTGNGLNNTLTGNSGNNSLNGGAGADTMAGGGGDDNYIVDNAGDVITESGGGGTDSVQSSVSFNLGAFTSLENLTLTGAGNIDGTGSGTSNILMGNGGNNILDGQGNPDTLIGGAGNDTIIGGLGNDQFNGGTGADNLNFGQNNDTAIFTSLLEAGDIVTGFSESGVSQDFIDLDGLFDTLGVAAGDRAGRVILINAGADTQLWIDSDGDTVADVQLLTFTGIGSGLTAGTAATDDIQVGS